jgi:tetratricopeptide (TPR) repeat protein
MRTLLVSLAFLATSVLVSAQVASPTPSINHVAVDPDNQSRYLYGPCDKSAFLKGEFKAWAEASYTAYTPDGSDCLDLLQNANWTGVKIDVFFATWCGDSKYQVPRFIRMSELAHVPDSIISYIALDGNKCGPSSEEASRQIHRVPTFIVSRNGTELGRVVEWTDRSLAEDLWRIVSRYRYQAHYAVANALMKEIETTGPRAITRNAEKRAEAARPLLKNVAELASVASVYFVRKQYEAAEAVALVNRFSFEQSPTAHYWLGRVAEQKGQLTDARRHYARALALDPKHSPSTQRLAQLATAKG